MNVTGITVELMERAEAQCQQPFLSWFAEARKARWVGEASLLAHFPRTWSLGNHSYHFSLRADDFGVLAMVHFGPGLMIVQDIASLPTRFVGRGVAQAVSLS